MKLTVKNLLILTLCGVSLIAAIWLLLVVPAMHSIA